jgi:hypothetical protein
MPDDPTDHDRGAAMLDELERLQRVLFSAPSGTITEEPWQSNYKRFAAELVAAFPELIKQARLASELTAQLRELYPFNGAPSVEAQLKEVIEQSCAFANEHNKRVEAEDEASNLRVAVGAAPPATDEDTPQAAAFWRTVGARWVTWAEGVLGYRIDADGVMPGHDGQRERIGDLVAKLRELTALLCTDEGQDPVERANALQSERLILLHKRETLVGEVESLRAALAEKDEHIKTLRRLYDNTMTCHEEATKLAHARGIENEKLRAEVAELKEQAEMACIEPRDDCDCHGCSYAAEVHAKGETKAKALAEALK